MCSKPVPAGSGCCLVGRTVSSGQSPAQDVWLQAPVAGRGIESSSPVCSGSIRRQSGAKPSPLQELSSLQAAMHVSVQVGEHVAESLHAPVSLHVAVHAAGLTSQHVDVLTSHHVAASLHVPASLHFAGLACAVAQHCYNGDVSFLWEKWKL